MDKRWFSGRVLAVRGGTLQGGGRLRRQEEEAEEVDSKVEILHTFHILTFYMPSISTHTAYVFLHMLFIVYVFHTTLHVQRLFPCFAVYLLLARLMHTHTTRRTFRNTLLRHIVASRAVTVDIRLRSLVRSCTALYVIY